MTYVEDKRGKRKQLHSYIKEIESDKDCNFKKDGFWLYCTHKIEKEAWSEKGFKIHLSATINNAYTILQIFFPYGKANKLEWKVIFDYRVLERQNLGKYGYSQIGKFITIYPKTNRELCDVLADLEIMFKGVRSVAIPSDYSYLNSEVVYYRYGDIISKKGSSDHRKKTMPADLQIPIDDYYIRHEIELPKHLFILEIINTNGKSSVYKVFDTNRRCVVYLKRASFLGNVDIYGADAVNRLQNEKRALLKLQDLDYVPKFIDQFYIGNSYFLEMTEVLGKSIRDWIESTVYCSEKKKIDITMQLVTMMIEIRNKGVFYNDLSFSNVLADKNGNLRIIDFEYSHLIDEWNLPEIIAGSLGFYTIDSGKSRE